MFLTYAAQIQGVISQLPATHGLQVTFSKKKKRCVSSLKWKNWFDWVHFKFVCLDYIVSNFDIKHIKQPCTCLSNSLPHYQETWATRPVLPSHPTFRPLPSPEPNAKVQCSVGWSCMKLHEAATWSGQYHYSPLSVCDGIDPLRPGQP